MMACKYCKGEKPLFSVEPNVIIIDWKLKITYTDTLRRERRYIPIDYCPKCCEKLGGDV